MISANVPNEVRKKIYRRDGYACALCGDRRHLAIHHVLPRGAGGGNSPYNLIALCRYCHAAAHGHFLEEGYPLSQEEVEQACVEYISDFYAGEWRPALDLNYSNPEVVAMTIFDIDEAIYKHKRGYIF